MADTLRNRRQVLEMGLGSLAGLSLLGLAGCGGSSGGTGDQVKMQLFFWGTTTRNELTRKAITLFEQSHSSVKITSQFTDFSNYWNKLNTQIAGGGAPDLIQMDMRYISQFAKKKQLVDLTTYISNKTIGLSDFDTTQIDSSKVDGSVYGISLGGNYQGLFYDVDMLKKANVGDLPQDKTWTWQEFADYNAKLTKALEKGVYGTSDLSYDITAFELWIRSRNKELYTTEGNIGFEQQDITAWYQYWSDMRKAGGCVPMDVQVGLGNNSGPDTSTVIKGKSVFMILYSNQFEAYQKATKRKMDMYTPPIGTVPGGYLKVSMLMSISTQSKHAQEAASFINFLINDQGAVKALGLERGTPGSAKARDLLQAQLTPAQIQTVNYFNRVAKGNITRNKLVLDPPGAGAVADALQRHAQAAGFGKESVTAAAEAFYKDAVNALKV